VNIPYMLSAILSWKVYVQTPYFQLRHYMEDSGQFHVHWFYPVAKLTFNITRGGPLRTPDGDFL